MMMVVEVVVVNGTPRTDPGPQQSQLLVTVCGPFISFSLFQGPFLFCCPSFFEEPQGQIWPGPDLNMGHINFSSPGHLGGGLKKKKKVIQPQKVINLQSAPCEWEGVGRIDRQMDRQTDR